MLYPGWDKGAILEAELKALIFDVDGMVTAANPGIE
jgi:hypothetical protein